MQYDRPRPKVCPKCARRYHGGTSELWCRFTRTDDVVSLIVFIVQAVLVLALIAAILVSHVWDFEQPNGGF